MTGPMAKQVARLLHPGDTAAQNQVEGRLAGLMQSKVGADVLAPDFGSGLFGQSEAGKQTSLSARFQALAAIDRNPDITAQSLGNSPWTNSPLVQTIAQAGEAQTALQTHTDLKTHQEIVATLPGTDLDNFIGMAMHLPPKDETAQQAAQREQATEQGQYSYFDTGHNKEPVRLVRNAIMDAAAAVGGDRNAPKVAYLPVTVSSKDTGPVQLPLFRVDGPKGSRFVDNEGHNYSSFEDWQQRNTLPEGVVSYPKGGHLSADPDGRVMMASSDTPETSNQLHHFEKGLDKAVLVGGLVAGSLVVATAGIAAAPWVLTGLFIYTAIRGGQDLYENASRGGTINPLESSRARDDWFNVAGGALTGVGAAAVGVERLAGATNVLSRSAIALGAASRTTAARVDVGNALNQLHDTTSNWDRMSAGDRVMAALNLGFWGAGAASQLHGGFSFRRRASI